MLGQFSSLQTWIAQRDSGLIPMDLPRHNAGNLVNGHHRKQRLESTEHSIQHSILISRTGAVNMTCDFVSRSFCAVIGENIR